MRVLRVASVAWGLAVGAWLAPAFFPGGSATLFFLLILPVFGLIWPTDSRRTVRCLDRAADLTEDLQCAWDHRDRSDAFAAAQRCRALERYVSRLSTKPVPWPHPAWGAAILLWVFPLFVTGESEALAEREVGHQTGAETMAQDPTAQDPTTAPSTGPTPRKDFLEAEEKRTPPQALVIDGDHRAEEPPGAPEVAGIGAKVGSLAAGESPVGLVALPEVADGPDTPDPPSKIESSNGSMVERPPAEINGAQLADPARPYPVRYHGVIREWFKESHHD